MYRRLALTLTALLIFESSAAARDTVQVNWDEFSNQLTAMRLAGRRARIALGGGDSVKATVFGADAAGLEVSESRKTRQWATNGGRARIPRDQIRSVRFDGRTSKRGRWIGALAGAGAGAAIAGAVIASNDVTEGTFSILIPAAACAAVPVGLLAGYFVGRAFDKSFPEFMLR